MTGQMRQEAVDAVLQLDAGGWQLRLAPTTIEAQIHMLAEVRPSWIAA